MARANSEQEKFWAGEFGKAYIDRNQSERQLAANTALLSRIFSRLQSVKSVLEFGANIGLNLRAIRSLRPEVSLTGVEINPEAVKQLKEVPGIDSHQLSILDWKSPKTFDFVLVKGLLIHLDPLALKDVYQVLHQATGRYLCLAEYYSPTPVEVPYHGHAKRLFKRDFAGELLERFPDLQLIDYGFVYHRDAHFPQDDLNWFVLEKISPQLGRRK